MALQASAHSLASVSPTLSLSVQFSKWEEKSIMTI